jgi:hypothetical protein
MSARLLVDAYGGRLLEPCHGVHGGSSFGDGQDPQQDLWITPASVDKQRSAPMIWYEALPPVATGEGPRGPQKLSTMALFLTSVDAHLYPVRPVRRTIPYGISDTAIGFAQVDLSALIDRISRTDPST